jgi:hypothetical protein
MKELRLYDKAHEMKIEEQDHMNFLMGEYFFDAIAAALSNMGMKKGDKPLTYTDIRKEPILKTIDKKQQEIDEKQAYENYRVKRMIDKLNWDLAHMEQQGG